MVSTFSSVLVFAMLVDRSKQSRKTRGRDKQPRDARIVVVIPHPNMRCNQARQGSVAQRRALRVPLAPAEPATDLPTYL